MQLEPDWVPFAEQLLTVYRGICQFGYGPLKVVHIVHSPAAFPFTALIIIKLGKDEIYEHFDRLQASHAES